MFVSIGYTHGKVDETMLKYIKKIMVNYTDSFTKNNSDEGPESRKVVYGGSIVHSRANMVSNWVCEMISDLRNRGEPSLNMVPGRKLKNVIYTKRRYLRRQRDQMSRYKNM